MKLAHFFNTRFSSKSSRLWLILVVILFQTSSFHSNTIFADGSCIHDQIALAPDEIQRVSLPSSSSSTISNNNSSGNGDGDGDGEGLGAGKQRRLTKDSVSNIRIFTYTTQLQTDITDDAVRTLFISKIIPAAVNMIQQTLGVSPVTENLFYGKTPCSIPWKSGSNSGQCAVAGKAVCGNISIPVDHLLPTTVCPTSNPTSCQDLPYGQGVANADLILYFSAIETGACNLGALAFSSACTLLTDNLDRPISGYVNLCSGILSSIDEYGEASHRALAIVHEIVHVLGFSKNLFPYWRDDSGNPRTARDSAGLPLTSDASDTTIKVFTERGRQVSKIVTSRVVAAVKEQFGCSSATGAELEDGGATTVTAGSHLEKRIFATELMMSDDSSPLPRLSTITLAILEDTGWYVVLSRAYQRTLTFGLKSGCDFLTRKCLDPLPIDNAFCSVASSLSCSIGREASTLCSISTYEASLPTYEQYFSNPAMGGSDSLIDYCPYWRARKAKRCSVLGDGDRTNVYGFTHGPDSLCYASKTAISPFPVPSTDYYDCFRSQCITVSGVQTLQVLGAGEWITCPAGTRITFKGYGGTLQCPNSTEMSWMCEAIQPLFPTLLPSWFTSAVTTTQPTTTAAVTTVRTTTTPKLGTTVATVSTTVAATTSSRCPANMYGTSCNVQCVADVTCNGVGSCHPASGVCVCNADYFGSQCATQASPLRATSATITSLGTKLTLDSADGDGISFPVGAVSSSLSISVSSYSSSVATFPSGYEAVSNLIVLSPKLQSLSQSATIQLRYSTSSTDTSSFSVFMFNYKTGAWETLSGVAIDSSTKIVSGYFSELTMFAILKKTTSSPSGVDPGTDSSGSSGSQGALYGGIGAAVAVLFVAGAAWYFRRRVLAAKDESKLEAREAKWLARKMEKDGIDVPPPEVPGGRNSNRLRNLGSGPLNSVRNDGEMSGGPLPAAVGTLRKSQHGEKESRSATPGRPRGSQLWSRLERLSPPDATSEQSSGEVRPNRAMSITPGYPNGHLSRKPRYFDDDQASLSDGVRGKGHEHLDSVIPAPAPAVLDDNNDEHSNNHSSALWERIRAKAQQTLREAGRDSPSDGDSVKDSASAVGGGGGDSHSDAGSMFAKGKRRISTVTEAATPSSLRPVQSVRKQSVAVAGSIRAGGGGGLNSISKKQNEGDEGSTTSHPEAPLSGRKLRASSKDLEFYEKDKDSKEADRGSRIGRTLSRQSSDDSLSSRISRKRATSEVDKGKSDLDHQSPVDGEGDGKTGSGAGPATPGPTGMKSGNSLWARLAANRSETPPRDSPLLDSVKRLSSINNNAAGGGGASSSPSISSPAPRTGGGGGGTAASSAGATPTTDAASVASQNKGSRSLWAAAKEKAAKTGALSPTNQSSSLALTEDGASIGGMSIGSPSPMRNSGLSSRGRSISDGGDGSGIKGRLGGSIWEKLQLELEANGKQATPRVDSGGSDNNNKIGGSGISNSNATSGGTPNLGSARRISLDTMMSSPSPVKVNVVTDASALSSLGKLRPPPIITATSPNPTLVSSSASPTSAPRFFQSPPSPPASKKDATSKAARSMSISRNSSPFSASPQPSPLGAAAAAASAGVLGASPTNVASPGVSLPAGLLDRRGKRRESLSLVSNRGIPSTGGGGGGSAAAAASPSVGGGGNSLRRQSLQPAKKLTKA